MEYTKLSTATWIVKAQKVHNGLYDYSDVDYKGVHCKIDISCRVHGMFSQTPSHHLSGNGCPKCANEQRGQKRRDTLETFLMKAKDIHKNTFDFSKVVYTTSKTPVEIKCTICNTVCHKQPKHILRGVGCLNCMYTAKRMDRIEFISKASVVHHNKYTYTNVQYINNSTKVLIHCTGCNISFKQSPINHLLGNGCPSCASSGFDPDKPAILYYLQIKHESSLYYKIGITNRTVNKRFSKEELKYITVLNTVSYTKGLNAFKEEQRLLSKYLKFRYDGPTILNSGHTELLTTPILELE